MAPPFFFLDLISIAPSCLDFVISVTDIKGDKKKSATKRHRKRARVSERVCVHASVPVRDIARKRERERERER